MLKLFKKDLLLFFNDQKSFVLTFLLPVILITLFAFAYGALGDIIERSDNTDLLMVDHDSTDLSAGFISDLDTLSGITIVKSEVGAARESITKGKYAAALVIGEGFSDSLYKGSSIPLEMLYDRDKELESGNLQAKVVRVLVSRAAGGYPIESFMPEMISILGDKTNTDLNLIQAVAGTAILMLLFSMASVGTSILDEKENGTINRLLYSPINSHTILYSKMLFAFFVAVLQLTVMFLFAWIFLGLDISVNITALIIMILATAFSISSVGIFLAAIAKSRQQAQSLSTLVILVMSAIGGSMIPLYFMPDIMSKIAVLSINYWGIQGFYDIFWRVLPLPDILPEILVLTGIGVVMTALSIRLITRNILKLL